jgi:hypothetical protein
LILKYPARAGAEYPFCISYLEIAESAIRNSFDMDFTKESFLILRTGGMLVA